MLSTRNHTSDFYPFFDIDDSEFESGADGLNWFVYCGNNPLVFVDPTGLAEEEEPSVESQGLEDPSDLDSLNEANEANEANVVEELPNISTYQSVGEITFDFLLDGNNIYDDKEILLSLLKDLLENPLEFLSDDQILEFADESTNPNNEEAILYFSPVYEAGLTDIYGERRTRFHNGIDLGRVSASDPADSIVNTPIKSAESGTVVRAVLDHPDYGKMVEILHPDGNFFFVCSFK